MSCRHADTHNAETINAEHAKHAEQNLSADSAGSALNVALRTLICNRGHLTRIERSEELLRALEIEFRVDRLDAQEKSIAARQCKSWDVEHRVIRLGKA